MDTAEWAGRIVAMMGDPDPGVAITAISLCTAMAQSNLDAFKGCYQMAVQRLDRVRFAGVKGVGRFD
jgi:AP-2 complex subunit alpha